LNNLGRFHNITNLKGCNHYNVNLGFPLEHCGWWLLRQSLHYLTTLNFIIIYCVRETTWNVSNKIVVVKSLFLCVCKWISLPTIWVLDNRPILVKEQCIAIIVVGFTNFKWSRTNFTWCRMIVDNSYACSVYRFKYRKVDNSRFLHRF